MKNTRFMEVLFSAVEKKDEELTNQVAKDIEDAKKNGVVDTDELTYASDGSGKVAITDKETGEVTIAEKAADEDDTYDMYPAMPDEQIEGFVHPEMDGVTPGQQVGAPDEKVESHMDGTAVISPNVPNGGLNPLAGNEPSVEGLAQCGPDGCCDGECDDQKEFSVSTDNSVVLRIFSDQEFCERIFSEVIESEETVKVGDLKVEKIPDEDAVLVTSDNTGDQAKVKLTNDEMEVTEFNSKNFSEEEQYNPLYVVGVDPINHVIVDAPEYSEDSAMELVQRLQEQGVDAVQVFECPDEAREYAINLLESLGVQNVEDVEEPEQVEFSDHNVYLTKFYTDNNEFMCRLFSETVNDIDASQNAIEEAINSGDQIETETEIITPISETEAVIEDKENGEFTKVTLEDENMNLEPLSEEEADELTKHIEISEDEEDDEEDEDDDDEEDEDDDDEEEDDDEDERDFSDIYTNEEETRFFSEHEEMTDYMCRLFSEEADSETIEDAIESGEQIENDTEVITPINDSVAIIEDKENGEFTKVVMDDEKLDVCPISEEEADELTKNLVVEDKEEVTGDEDEEDEDERDYSYVYSDDNDTRFFSEHEEMTDYMCRLFSEEANEEDIEKAIEEGEVVITDRDIITPISETEAVIEDKENGEFTKVTMDDEKLDVKPLSEEEADELEKKFSSLQNSDDVLVKFFSEQVLQSAPVAPATPVLAGEVDPNMPVIPVNVETPATPAEGEILPVEAQPGASQQNTVEAIEDKALAAVQSIQDMAQQASDAIIQAKQTPVVNQEQDLREASFSEVNEENYVDNTLSTWLGNNVIK